MTEFDRKKLVDVVMSHEKTIFSPLIPRMTSLPLQHARKIEYEAELSFKEMELNDMVGVYRLRFVTLQPNTERRGLMTAKLFLAGERIRGIDSHPVPVKKFFAGGSVGNSSIYHENILQFDANGRQVGNDHVSIPEWEKFDSIDVFTRAVAH